MRVGIAVKPDVSDSCGGHQLCQTVHHAKPRAQNGNDRKLLSRESFEGSPLNGGLDLHVLEREHASDLIAHKHRDLGKKLAKRLGGGVLVSHDGELVLNQRMVHEMKNAHDDIPFIGII